MDPGRASASPPAIARYQNGGFPRSFPCSCPCPVIPWDGAGDGTGKGGMGSWEPGFTRIGQTSLLFFPPVPLRRCLDPSKVIIQQAWFSMTKSETLHPLSGHYFTALGHDLQSLVGFNPRFAASRRRSSTDPRNDTDHVTKAPQSKRDPCLCIVLATSVQRRKPLFSSSAYSATVLLDLY